MYFINCAFETFYNFLVTDVKLRTKLPTLANKEMFQNISAVIFRVKIEKWQGQYLATVATN